MSSRPTHPSDLALETLLDVLDEAVLVFDEALVCRAAGRRAAALLGLDPGSCVGEGRAHLLARITHAAPELAGPLAALEACALSPERVEIDPLEITGPPPRSFVWTSAPVVKDGVVVGRIDVVRDQSASAAMARKLDEVSLVDTLTGLSNRRRFEEECEREHRRAQRVWDSYAVARVDVDGMGVVNEALGREKGDALLRLLGEALRSSRRQYDVVARWGNDDFVLLLPCVDHAAVKSVLARAATHMVSAAKDAGYVITLRVGVAVWRPPSSDSAADVLGRAAAALDAAKRREPGAILVDLGGTNIKSDLEHAADEPPERIE
ncbi:GGDEF domain-containing protein [Polyangium jinanense]|uniref:GGDEF domain-containing protein n=1 Tax=Polyangium jinanense TaxID=2829994 RepID=UPI00234110D5|nr:GGDEF domain-containing protein [Polyangium jinanense]MDC3960340.1 GGDEF domain-containing protein [Polyangium jinanense]